MVEPISVSQGVRLKKIVTEVTEMPPSGLRGTTVLYSFLRWLLDLSSSCTRLVLRIHPVATLNQVWRISITSDQTRY